MNESDKTTNNKIQKSLYGKKKKKENDGWSVRVR